MRRLHARRDMPDPPEPEILPAPAEACSHMDPACPDQAAALAALEALAERIESDCLALREQAKRCRAASVCGRMSAAFRAYPEILSVSIAPRGMSLGLSLDLAGGESIGEGDIDFDERPSPRDAPWHLFDALFAELLSPECSVHWNIAYDDECPPVGPGSPIEIAAALGMDWMLPWIEASAIASSAAAPSSLSKPKSI